MSVFALALTACVTTTNSPLEKKKDLSKAETTYVQIAYAHLAQGNVQEAKRAVNRALEINKNSAGALIGLGLVYSAEDEPKLAEKEFKSAIRYDDTEEARYQYATFLYNQGRYDASYKQMKTVTEDTNYKRRAQAFDILGLVTLRLERPSEASRHFNKAITLNRQLASAYINLANAHVSLEDNVKAYDAYQGFAKLAKLNLAAHNAATLWMGVQLAHVNEDIDAEGSYSLQLKNLYPKSKEYQAYVEWRQEQGASN